MKITKRQFDRLVEGLVKEQWADWELGLGEKPDEQDEKFPFPNDPDLHDNDLEDEDLNEQFEWTDEELASMNSDKQGEDEEADQWFSDFTGELTGTEDEDDDYPWDDEFVGKADRSERGMQEAKKKKKKSPSEKVRKPTAPPSRQHKDPTKYDRKRDKKVHSMKENLDPLQMLDSLGVDTIASLARMYTQVKDFEKVKKCWEYIAEHYPNSPWAYEAKEFLKTQNKQSDLNETRPISRRGSMMQGKGENVSSFFVNKMMAEIKRLLKGKMDWVDLDSIQRLEKALTDVARQAYSELDEVD